MQHAAMPITSHAANLGQITHRADNWVPSHVTANPFDDFPSFFVPTAGHLTAKLSQHPLEFATHGQMPRAQLELTDA